MVKEYYRHAQDFYLKKNYELCLTSLKDMNRFIHAYKNSEELAANCEDGIQKDGSDEATTDDEAADEPADD